MELKKVHEISIDSDESIIATTLSKPAELIILLDSGNVIKYDFDKKIRKQLFSVKSCIGYTDGGFDLNAKSTIYTLDEIVVVVNDYKRHGFIHYPEKYDSLHLLRGDYHADISCYPIALYKNELNVPHIIYGVDWNHVQIMNLETRQVLTASKSLIEENAEENHINFYKNYSEGNKLPWPSQYDYFYGELHLSPNKKSFLSAGWLWGSCDLYKVYDIENFINNNRILDKDIGGWEHNNRAVCWIDNTKIAITFCPNKEDDDATKDTPCEIHFYKIINDQVELENKIKLLNLDISTSKMFYSNILSSIILFSDSIGVVVLSSEGEILFQDNKLKFNEYNLKTNLFIQKTKKTISVFEIKK